MAEHTEPTSKLRYEDVLDEFRRHGAEKLGPQTSYAWRDDPKHLGFTLARYKFVAKMLDGSSNVLEIGCGDGFGARVVAQTVENLTAVDLNPDFIAAACALANDQWPIRFLLHDAVDIPVPGSFDAVYSLDMFQYIEGRQEHAFFTNVLSAMTSNGVLIIGVPSSESQAYASKFSKMGAYCRSQTELKEIVRRYFQNAFMFSMNDEVLHTGYSKMSHYFFAVCCGPKKAQVQVSADT